MPRAYIEFDSLRFARIAKHRAPDFPAAPTNSEMIRRAAPPSRTSATHAFHATRSPLALPLHARHRCAARASRTTEIPTVRCQRSPAELPTESISSAKISAELALQAGPTPKDPLRSAGRFPWKY